MNCFKVRGIEHIIARCTRRLGLYPATPRHNRRLPQGPRRVSKTARNGAMLRAHQQGQCG